jgi:hypothetical protein
MKELHPEISSASEIKFEELKTAMLLLTATFLLEKNG